LCFLGCLMIYKKRKNLSFLSIVYVPIISSTFIRKNKEQENVGIDLKKGDYSPHTPATIKGTTLCSLQTLSSLSLLLCPTLYSWIGYVGDLWHLLPPYSLLFYLFIYPSNTDNPTCMSPTQPCPQRNLRQLVKSTNQDSCASQIHLYDIL